MAEPRARHVRRSRYVVPRSISRGVGGDAPLDERRGPGVSRSLDRHRPGTELGARVRRIVVPSSASSAAIKHFDVPLERAPQRLLNSSRGSSEMLLVSTPHAPGTRHFIRWH